MSLEHINPDSIFDSEPYSFSQVVLSKGSRLIHISGQTSQDKDMNIIGVGDLAAQAKGAFDNVKNALDAAGATKEDIASFRIYVVDYKLEHLEIIGRATAAFLGSAPAPASTMIGVQALALPEYLIEIETTAVID